MDNQKPVVTVSCGTKFHSDYMSYQLQQHGMLQRVITAHPARKYLNRTALDKKRVIFLIPIFAFLVGLKKIIGNFHPFAKKLEYVLPIWYDKMASFFIGKPSFFITWAWSGLASIREAKKKGAIVIVEECGSCNKFQNEILSEEYAALGLTFKTITPEFIVQRELEEVNLADVVLCPSKHVARSFIANGIVSEKCKIIPYGVNLQLFTPSSTPKKAFQVLFVGSIGPRKGVIYFLKALQLLKNDYQIEGKIIGKIETGFESVLRPFDDLFIHIERVPHHELVKHYNEASVFVFPSLDEGMAYVQLEAMASGLPIICTPNSGGDSVIEEGVDGFIVPIRDEVAISERIAMLYNNGELLTKMSVNAVKKAGNFTWDNYGIRLSNLLNELHSNKKG